MAGYSRDIERQNQALQNILDGGKPEKRIFITKEDLEYKKDKKEKQKKNENESIENLRPLKRLECLGFVQNVIRL